MKIVKSVKEEIKKEEFEEKLGIKIKEWLIPKDDNFLKIYTQTGYIIYLRCDDMKRLFGIDINVFDEDYKIDKDKLTLKNLQEVYRGKPNHLSKILKGL